MKRTLAILAVAGVLGAATQSRADALWTIGLKAGPSIATIEGDDVADSESRISFVAGGFAQADFSDQFALRFELLYFGKGADSDADGSLKLGYMELPILLVGKFPMSDTSTFSIFAGPTIGINVGAEAELELFGVEFDGDVSEYVADVEFGVTLGMGAAFDVGSVVLGIDARYDVGMTSLEGEVSYGADVDAKNRAWAIMAGVGFPLGR